MERHELEDEQRNIRDRLHRMADVVQVHDNKITEHRVMLEHCTSDLKTTREEMVTRDQLDGVKDTMLLRIEQLAGDLAPIRTGIWWLVGLIVSSVIIALLSLVLYRNDARAQGFEPGECCAPHQAQPAPTTGTRDR